MNLMEDIDPAVPTSEWLGLFKNEKEQSNGTAAFHNDLITLFVNDAMLRLSGDYEDEIEEELETDQVPKENAVALETARKATDELMKWLQSKFPTRL